MAVLPDQSRLAFPVAEYRSRLAAFRAALAAAGVDVYLGTTPENLNYLSGFDPLGLYFYQQLFVTPGHDRPVLLTHRCEAELARTQCWTDDVRVWQHGQDPVELTVGILRELGLPRAGRLGLELDNWYLTAATYRRLVAALPEVEIVDVGHLAAEQRMIKSPLEIERLRAAAGLADLGMATVIEHLRPGMREVDLHARVQRALTSAGGEYPSLPTIIGSGPRSGLFHAVPTERVIEPDEPVMVEISGVSARYQSNIVRTLVAGRASAPLTELWKIATEAFWAAYAEVRPGVPVGAVDAASRAVRREYAEHVPARAGFGVGLAYPPTWAALPDILEGDERVLAPGMVFSLEPSVAQYQGVSVIFGYNVLVTESGAEILHTTPAEVFEVLPR